MGSQQSPHKAVTAQGRRAGTHTRRRRCARPPYQSAFGPRSRYVPYNMSGCVCIERTVLTPHRCRLRPSRRYEAAREADIHRALCLHQRLDWPPHFRSQAEAYVGRAWSQTLHCSWASFCHARTSWDCKCAWRRRRRSRCDQDPEGNFKVWWQSRQVRHC
jgi:hypothetical protein